MIKQRGLDMAFERNKQSKNPSRRPMSVADMTMPISKENQKLLKLLDEMDKKRNQTISERIRSIWKKDKEV